MTLRVSGKNLDIGEVLRNQAEERLEGAVQKYFDGGFSGHVTVEKDGPDFKTECSVHLDSGASMNVSATAGDAYASLNHAIDRITKQLRRNKRKTEDHGSYTPPVKDLENSDSNFDDYDDEPTGTSAALIAEPLNHIAVMSMAHAVLALERDGMTAMIFKNVGTRNFNYIHRRADGHIGWMDLSEETSVKA